MKTRCAIAVVFLMTVVLYFCLVLHIRGQAFTPLRPFILQSTATVNTNPESILPFGMKYWYKATDLSNTPVSDWVDRIKGYHWWQTNVPSQPTWDTNGVHFNGSSQYLHATNGGVETAQGFDLAIFKFEDTGGAQMLIDIAYAGGSIFIGKDTANQLYGGNGVNIGPVGTGIIDLVAGSTNFNLYRVWTNTVIAWTNNGAWNNVPNWNFVGSGNANGFAKVTLKEFIVWTNTLYPAATNYLTPTIISNLHWYATNVWHYSP